VLSAPTVVISHAVIVHTLTIGVKPCQKDFCVYNPDMARPAKPPDEVASERIDLRLTTAERIEYEQAAKRAEQSLSAWIRERLTKAAKRESKRD
jgi:predicted HicB family RNase H-like nuclease